MGKPRKDYNKTLTRNNRLQHYVEEISKNIDRLIEEDPDMLVETAFMHIIISGKNKYRNVMVQQHQDFLEKLTDIYPESMMDLGTYRILKRLMKKNYFTPLNIKSIAINWMMSRVELEYHSNLEEWDIDDIMEVIEEIKQRNEN